MITVYISYINSTVCRRKRRGKKKKHKNVKRSKRDSNALLGWRLLRFSFCVFLLFFFFSRVFFPLAVTVYVRYMNSNRNFLPVFMNSISVHCLRSHKFHFLSIFSLKMGLTVLFIHLEIILLQ